MLKRICDAGRKENRRRSEKNRGGTKMTEQEIRKMAEESGFSRVSVIRADQLVFDPSLRKYCEDNLCGNFGKNYSCPPFCGTPEEMKKKTEKYTKAWIFQTVGDVGSWEDSAEIRRVRDAHNGNSRELIRKLRENGQEGLTMLAGPCTACGTCAGFRGEPCRYPENVPSCISAYCMKAEEMAKTAGLEYWCGEGKVAFFSLYLTD
jgi:predicted metal-binding protein